MIWKTLKHAQSLGFEDPSHCFSFNSPKDFWEFRAEWKTHYKDISKRIRYAKTHRKPSKPDYDSAAQSGLWALQQEARLEMGRLTAAREEGKARRAKAKEAQKQLA